MVTGLPAGTPSINAVLEVVRDALRDEVVPATADRPQYVVRMACRLLEIVQRELDEGHERGVDLEVRLHAIGATDESVLAAGLVDGSFDTADGFTRDVIHDLVQWRIAVARPDYLEATDDAGP